MLFSFTGYTVEISEDNGGILVKLNFKRKFAGVFLQNALPNMLLSVIVYTTNLYYRKSIKNKFVGSLKQGIMRT